MSKGEGLMAKGASALLRECREGKHGEEARKVVEELDCLAAPRMMCLHEWAFLRQEPYPISDKEVCGPFEVQSFKERDLFYCRRCLEYRRVEGE